MHKIFIEKCSYCGSSNLELGYQGGYGVIYSAKHLFKSCKIYHVICTDCGSVVHTYVDKPEKFR